ncbi:MAG: glycosyltransferase family 4 protein [Euryarchaeota archaeon]|nr:glycosyltransferase family 4 protein [Euryarchaeota archaeon]
METCKIALASDWYYPKVGGVETHIHNLARNLVERGHEVEIITHKYAEPGIPAQEDSIPCHRIDGAVFRSHEVLADPRSLVQLKATVEKGDYDIVHGHGITSPISLFSCRFGGKSGSATVLTNHSLLRGVRPNLLVRRILGPFVSSVDAVIAVSTPVAEETRRMRKGPIFVVPNGIGSVDAEKDPPPMPVVTTVSRLVKKKNVMDLVRIAPRLVESYPDIQFRIIGDGPERVRIEREVRARGLEGHFTLLGLVPREDVYRHLGSSTVFALPSSDEAFGISILEAMACGVPVVAKNHSGVSDIVTQGKNGLMADSPEELESHIRKLLSDEEARRRMAEEGLSTVREFRWERVTDRVLEVYEGVLS